MSIYLSIYIWIKNIIEKYVIKFKNTEKKKKYKTEINKKNLTEVICFFLVLINLNYPTTFDLPICSSIIFFYFFISIQLLFLPII